jgi:L-asparagine transporter-like permease
MWALLVGFFLPLAISVIQQAHWSDAARAIVAFIVCLIAGAGTAYFNGDLNAKDWVSAALIILVTAVATYKNFWKPTNVAPVIELATMSKKAKARLNPPEHLAA